jgi:hypothetical protein
MAETTKDERNAEREALRKAESQRVKDAWKAQKDRR